MNWPKRLGMENKDLVDILQKKNVEIKNHMMYDRG